jgi:hypothetical protein
MTVPPESMRTSPPVRIEINSRSSWHSVNVKSSPVVTSGSVIDTQMFPQPSRCSMVSPVDTIGERPNEMGVRL